MPITGLDRHASLAMTKDIMRRVLPATKSILSRAALIAALPIVLTANGARADEASMIVAEHLSLAKRSYGTITSDDGLIGTGRFEFLSSTDYHAFLWNDGTLIDLGTLGGTNSRGHYISADGTIVIGYSQTSGDAAWRGFRWTDETGMVDMGTLGGTNSYLHGMVPDGSVMVGYSQTTGNTASHGFRWTQSSGMVDLGTLGGTNSTAYGISSDGQTIVGESQLTGNTATHAYRWTQSSGMIDLGTLGGTNSYTQYVGRQVSGDGSVVVGGAQTTGNTSSHAFRWTQETGMVDLGLLPGGGTSTAYSVSNDGRIVVGVSNNRAFRWTAEDGLQDLNTLLADAGVDMTDYTLMNAVYITPNNKYYFGTVRYMPTFYQTAYLACYDPGENGCVGLTTASKQEEAAIDLASNQQIAMTESRSAANELMGFTRPMTMGTQTFSGAMFGSAMGYAGGQYTKDRFTLLGGLGYGAQDYKYIKPENSLTVASGLRYTFDSVVSDQSAVGALSPFVEAGGWYTPDMEVALSRPYNNGTGTNRGEGNTNSSSWAEYLKAGLLWDQSEVNQFTAYGEIGRQHMLFDGYSETATSTNPFPATINDSEMTFNFARAGGSWTHQLDKFLGKPVSFTVAGAVAHSFGVKTNLTTTVSGVGTARAIAKKNLWAEYGGRLSSDLTDNVALNLDVTGTTGNNGMGTAIHGGAGVSVKF